MLLGGNVGEIAFNVLGAAVTGRSPLNARQILLVNLLTDLAPAMAIVSRRPDPEAMDELLREGPESSLGKPLYSEIGVRAGTTTVGATAAWLIARFTGRRRRASTVALAALVGTQLGQTLTQGWRNPAVLASGLGSAAVLAALVQTPGASQFFGCTPLGPVGWGSPWAVRRRPRLWERYSAEVPRWENPHRGVAVSAGCVAVSAGCVAVSADCVAVSAVSVRVSADVHARTK